jgi:DNA-binding winged helix-turn-helix (wHTH) protein/tetratricopeptide (TPR) repeat protein
METRHLYNFGPFQIDSAKRLLQRDRRQIPLPAKAFEALLLLVRNRDRLVKKDELMRDLWPDTTVEENNLSQSISAIRKALGDTAQEHHYIETVPGWGYRFAAEVKVLSRDKMETPAVTRHFPPPQKRWPDRKFLVAGIVAVLMVLLAVTRVQKKSARREVSATAPSSNTTLSPSRRSVAILGFQNLSANRNEDAWLSTALSEMLSTELAAGGTLRIISADDIARVKTELPSKETGSLTKDKLQQIDQNLGSDLLIFGSYIAIGDKSKKIRLDLRLENAKSGDMITAIAETGAQSNLFDLVSSAGVRLRQKLGISDLSPTEALVVRASLPSNPLAARLYSEGLARLRVFDAISGRDLLVKAIALEPNYPLAHSALSDAWSVLGYDGKAGGEARKAFQLSKSLSPEDQLSVEGRYRSATREWSKAVEVYRALVALFPDDLDYGLRLAAAQTATARPHDALVTLDQLRSLSPPAGKDPRIDVEASRAWNSLGDFKRIEGVLQAAVRNAQTQGARLLLARARNQQCHAWHFLGEQQKAIDACQEAQQIYSAAGDRGAEADTLRLLGDVVADSDVAGAMRSYRQALTIQREIGHLSGQAIVLNQIAIQYSNQGDHAAAANFFEQALAIFRRLGDQVTATGMMINISSELSSQGHLDQARKLYLDTIKAAIALGNKDIQGLATYDVALIDQLRGDLDKAQEEFQQASKLFEAVEDKNQVTTAINSLGEIAMAKGDFAAAQQFYETALGIRQSTQQRVPAAESQLDLALLSFEKGDPAAQIENSVRQLVEVFHSGKSVNDEATAEALLARILLAREKRSEARAMVEQALLLSAKADTNVQLSVAVTAAYVQAAADQSRARQMAANLEKTIAQTRKLGYFGIELDARLTLGEIEMKSGAVSRGRGRLEAVKKDASERGFMVLAGKAASDSA